MCKFQFSTVSVSVLITVLAAAVSAQNQIDKPVLMDDQTLGEITNQFYGQVPGVPFKAQEWGPDYYPASCVSEAQSGNKCAISDIKVYDVTYEDCPQPWTMCHCGRSNVSPERMFEFFARVPVKSRAAIRHMFAWPDKEGLAAYAFGPDIGLTNSLQTSDGKQDMNVIIHETGHVVDQGASDSEEMINAINSDSCVLREYSKVSRGENLANLMVMTYFKMINPTEYDRVHAEKGMSCLQNQLTYVDKLFSDRMTPGGTCPPRINENSEKMHLPGGVLSKRDFDILRRLELPPGNWTMYDDYGMYPPFDADSDFSPF